MKKQTSNKTSMNWLITGGCGFIGTSLIEALRSAPQAPSIRVLDNLSVGSQADLSEVTPFVVRETADLKGRPDGLELVVGDIRDFETCLRCCDGIDTVIHLAANTGVAPSIQEPRRDLEINVIGTFNLLEAATQQGVTKLVFASSGATVGEVEPPIHENQAPKPASPYGASKLAGEAYCMAYCQTFSLPTIILRFGNTYGPKSKHKSSVVAKFFKQALAGEALEIYGDGNQTRDFIYIDDLLQAVRLASLSDQVGEVFQIATFKETTVNEIAQKIKQLVEQETRREVKALHGEPLVGEVRRNYSDISKARRLLGFEPRFDIDAGLKATFGYFLSQPEH